MQPMPEDENFIKKTFPLPFNHGWKCKAGNNLFVAERGAAAFEIPDKWVVQHDGKLTVSIHDQAPPKDVCRISLTIFHLPPVEGGWSQLPLDKLFLEATTMKSNEKKDPGAHDRKPAEIQSVHRPDLEMVWADKGDWPDPENGKPIHCRQIMARARLVQVLISFDVYKDVEAKFESVWRDLLRTLRVAVPLDLTGQVGN
jgi:hypothetical protein